MVALGTLFLSNILDSKIRVKKKTFVILWAVFAAFIAGICLYSLKYFSSLIDDVEKHAVFVQWVAKLYALDLFLLLLIFVFLKKTKMFIWALLFLVLLEVGSHIMIYEPVIDTKLFFPKTELTNFLHENLGNYRFLSVSRGAYLGPNMGSAYQISDVKNYDAMLVKDFSDAFGKYSVSESSSQDINSIDPAYLNFSGVKYIIAKNKKDLLQGLASGEEVLDQYPQVLSGKKFGVFENKNVLPRAFFVHSDLIGKEIPWAKEDIDEKSPVDVKGYTNNSVTLSVNNSREGYIILTDTFFPGWKAYVDGNKEEIKKTALAFRAVYLEPGNHEVVFKYQPFSFHLGFWVSAISLLAILFSFFVEHRKKMNLDKAKKII
jgi:hypothetical protein